MDGMPRELHFSHDNIKYRAIFIDNIRGGGASDEDCCICGEQLKNLAYYTTEPLLFYAHVACALHHPDVAKVVSTIPPSREVRDRGLFSGSNPSYHPMSTYATYAPYPSFPTYAHNYGQYAPYPYSSYSYPSPRPTATATYGPGFGYAQTTPTWFPLPYNSQHGSEDWANSENNPNAGSSSSSSSSSWGQKMGVLAKGALRVFLQVLVTAIVTAVV